MPPGEFLCQTVFRDLSDVRSSLGKVAKSYAGDSRWSRGPLHDAQQAIAAFEYSRQQLTGISNALASLAHIERWAWQPGQTIITGLGQQHFATVTVTMCRQKLLCDLSHLSTAIQWLESHFGFTKTAHRTVNRVLIDNLTRAEGKLRNDLATVLVSLDRVDGEGQRVDGEASTADGVMYGPYGYAPGY